MWRVTLVRALAWFLYPALDIPTAADKVLQGHCLQPCPRGQPAHTPPSWGLPFMEEFQGNRLRLPSSGYSW